MQKIIRNIWRSEAGAQFERAEILSHRIHPEGLDIGRIRFPEAGEFAPAPELGHIISVISGSGVLKVGDDGSAPLRLAGGVHLYLPPGLPGVLHAEPGTELVQVTAPSASQARGKELLLRDEAFLSACCCGSQSLRWSFTPQYLSRRIFLHHDPVLLSKSGHPVSWYRTTMFDVAGLPLNEEGEPVFKMSYNSRTECNVCCDVKGTARVRMAKHPYRQKNQLWGPWFTLDGETTYHLNEAAGSPEEELRADEATGALQHLRNKHEVYIDDGYVTLFCIFDPAPAGVENHRPGEYTDYEPLSQVLGTEAYQVHRREIARYDGMVDQLSLAKAAGTLGDFRGSALWDLYLRGRRAQLAIESALVSNQAQTEEKRGQVLSYWMQPAT